MPDYTFSIGFGIELGKLAEALRSNNSELRQQSLINVIAIACIWLETDRNDFEKVWQNIEEERERQKRMAYSDESNPDWVFLGVMQMELGKMATAMVQSGNFDRNTEIVHVAAVAVAWLEVRGESEHFIWDVE